MSAKQKHPTALVGYSSHLAEELMIADGVRSYVTNNKLDWNVVPVDYKKVWAKTFIDDVAESAVFIGRLCPDIAQSCPKVAWAYDSGDIDKSMREAQGVVRFDVDAIGEVAYNYLLGIGARSLAILRDNPASEQPYRGARVEAFRQCAARAGMPIHVLCDESCDGEDTEFYFERLRYLRETLPKPIGVFCYHDHVARRLVHDLIHIDLKVPQDYMILGGNNLGVADSQMPISSVRLPYAALGRAAAGLAHQLLSHSVPNPNEVVITPTMVEERATTAIDKRSNDPLIKRALQRIERKRLPLPSVAELAKYCNCRRQRLFEQFKYSLGCSPQQWLEERAMQRAARLLVNTDLDVTTIAKQCNFSHRRNFSTQFKKRYGITPSTFRKLQR